MGLLIEMNFFSHHLPNIKLFEGIFDLTNIMGVKYTLGFDTRYWKSRLNLESNQSINLVTKGHNC